MQSYSQKIGNLFLKTEFKSTYLVLLKVQKWIPSQTQIIIKKNNYIVLKIGPIFAGSVALLSNFKNPSKSSLNSFTFLQKSNLFYLKFGLSEKHTKFEKNLPHGFEKSAELLSKRQNHDEDFFKLCALLKKSELY